MKILGNSYQEKEPSPTEPIEIINEAFLDIEVNEKYLKIPIKNPLKEGDKFKKIDGKGYLIKRVSFKEK